MFDICLDFVRSIMIKYCKKKKVNVKTEIMLLEYDTPKFQSIERWHLQGIKCVPCVLENLQFLIFIFEIVISNLARSF